MSIALIKTTDARPYEDVGPLSIDFSRFASLKGEFEAEGLLSVAVQHEMDHLLGKVFVDYLSPLKRSRIRTRMLKKTRDEART